MPAAAEPPSSPASRKRAHCGGRWWRDGLLSAITAMVLGLVALATPALALSASAKLPHTSLPPAALSSVAAETSYRCDGDPLVAQLVRGAVDDPAIPDPSVAPVPVGGVVVLHWRELNLQLPRTNNAGPASFSDGRWWWSLEDGAHPRFRLRRALGDVQDFACEPG